MNRRFFSSVVALLYVSVAVVLGVMHHHEHATLAGHADECTACEWQLQAATDVPVVAVISSIIPVVERPVRLPATITPAAPFLSATASRAPPVTPA